MSSSDPSPPSIVRPGPAPEGPPGWKAERIRKEQVIVEQREADQEEHSGGLQGLKDKVHRVGEKLHLVEPKNPSEQTAAQQQNASTGPEFAPRES